VFAGLVGWTVSSVMHFFVGSGARGSLLAFALGGVALLAVYVGGLRLLRVRELADLASPLRRALGA
jgi:hypothetical protein